MTGPLSLGVVNLVVAGALLVFAVAMSRIVRSGVTTTLTWAALRTLVQLLALGYVLAWIFEVDSFWAVMGMFVLMLGAAAVTAATRPKQPLPGLLAYTTGTLAVGSALTAVVVCMFVVRVDPWWEPRYFLPLAGMILGNSMNAVALAAERLQAEVASRRDEIEQLLALGASPRQAVDAALRETYRAAFLPLTNMMLTAGIVSIPGMMNGQILSGTDPTLASRYQVVVMYMISAAVTLSVTLLGMLVYRRFFTRAWQLRHDLLPE